MKTTNELPFSTRKYLLL